MTVDVKTYRLENGNRQSQHTTVNVKEYTRVIKEETLQRTLKNKRRSSKHTRSTFKPTNSGER